VVNFLKNLKMKKGFTLLELLTVVIIISILTSIALPQFFKAAERARASEAVGILGSLRAAQLRYYTQHGRLANNVDDLDVDVLGLKYFDMPQVIDPLYSDENVMIAWIQRLEEIDNPGYGSYTLEIYINGDIKCIGAKCPSGFLVD
jgi:prepilin-type N-terminal cleavage/methylation domain-containing protein